MKGKAVKFLIICNAAYIKMFRLKRQFMDKLSSTNLAMLLTIPFIFVSTFSACLRSPSDYQTNKRALDEVTQRWITSKS